MREIALILAISLFTFNCTQNNNNFKNSEDKKLFGTWKLVEVYSNTGADSGVWNTVENGYTYTFLSNSQFSSERFLECENGMFSLENNELILDFECDDFTAGIESPQGTFVEEITFESNSFILIPTYLNCIEGCGWKFMKIDN